MRFSTQDLLIFTGCLAGYIGFWVAMTRAQIDDSEWPQALMILMPLPFVLWLGHLSYKLRAGPVLLTLKAKPSREVFAMLVLLPLGFNLLYYLRDPRDYEFPWLFTLLYGAYVAYNWRRCRLRDRKVSAFGFSNDWKNRPAELITSATGVELWIALGGIGTWVVHARVPIPPDRTEQVRAILIDKQGEESPIDADQHG